MGRTPINEEHCKRLTKIDIQLECYRRWDL